MTSLVMSATNCLGVTTLTTTARSRVVEAKVCRSIDRCVKKKLHSEMKTLTRTALNGKQLQQQELELAVSLNSRKVVQNSGGWNTKCLWNSSGSPMFGFPMEFGFEL